MNTVSVINSTPVNTLSASSSLREEQIQLECVRTLYRQIPNSFAAALGVTLYMAVALWKSVPTPLLGGWLGMQAIAQLHRFAVLQRYRAADVTAFTAQRWMRNYTFYMANAGVVWALCPFLFFRTDNALTQALTMCGLYGISAGSVPGNAYHPPAVRIFLVLIYGAVLIRTLMIGSLEYTALGIASLFFMVIMLLFCNIQHRSIIESIRTRFENTDLVAQLQIEKNNAEKAQARAEQADLAKSQFLAAASHDLRQPLHALGLFSATLRELKLDAQQQLIVEQIYRNIDSLEALFDELLDISKLDAGYVRPQPMHFPLQRIFNALDDRYRALADEKGLRLHIRNCANIVFSDLALLERILGNLIANAIRYTVTGGVLVGCRKRGEKLQVDIWDTGIGISPEQQQRIFEEFYQVGNPERDRRKGLGLGLAIAERTAALLNTAITVQSQVGRGSVFRFEIALGDADEVTSTAPELPVTGDALSGQCVVVIDDESSIRQGMSNLLTQWGCAAVVADDTDAAVSQLRSRNIIPALIIADYRLREATTGVQAVAALRNQFGESIPALLITGDTAAQHLFAAKQSGLPVLHKPVRPAQLRAVCNFLLTKSAR